MSDLRKKQIWVIMGIMVAFLGIYIFYPTGRDMARDADRRADAMYDSYYEDPLKEAIDAVLDYVNFLETHKAKLAPLRQIDSMLFSGHSIAGYLFLYAGNVENACTHLNSAYDYHRRHRLPLKIDPVPRDEFVDFVITGKMKVDSNFEVAWKKSAHMDTNVVVAVKVQFRNGGVH